MRRRFNRKGSTSLRRRRDAGPDTAAVPVVWEAHHAHRDWLDDVEADPGSNLLAERLAEEYGLDPVEIDDAELFESFLDALEADASAGRGRSRWIN